MSKSRPSLVIAVALGIAASAHAEVWLCTQKDGSLLYTDHAGPGCKEVTETLQTTPLPTVPRSEVPAARERSRPAVKELPAGSGDQRSTAAHVFAAARRVVPSLLVSDLPESVRAKGFYAPNRGDIVLVDIAVTHLANGNGPFVEADSHFQQDARLALRRSLYAAAYAVGYDPRFLSVRLTLPTAPAFDHGYQVDGPSASVGWAVAIASAVLGDSMRTDVCLTGTMSESLDVGKVGGLEYKIDGCHKFGFREMIVPAGQHSFDLDLKRQSYSMKLTQVSTLAEAYEAATGQALREAR